MYIGETYYHYIYGQMKVSKIQRIKDINGKEDVYVTFNVLDVKSVHPRFRKAQVTFNEFNMKYLCFTDANQVKIINDEYQHMMFVKGR